MKLDHKSVAFEHPAKGVDHCGDCVNWQGPVGQCKIVRPPVRPVDWCNKFEEKS